MSNERIITAEEAKQLKTLLQGLLQHLSEVVREQAAWSLAQAI